MTWPRRRRAVQWVQQEVEKARAEKTEAQKRREKAHELAVESNAVSARLRREIARNGFTELLQQAMGGH